MKFEKRKVVMLPTDDETMVLVNTYRTNTMPLVLSKQDARDLHSDNTEKELELRGYKHQHLYFTSDEEIKAGDGSCMIWEGKVLHTKVSSFTGVDFSECRKIIASTDKSLGLPTPSQQFIEDYCKNPVDEVMVGYGRTMDGSDSYNRLHLTNNEITIKLVEEKMYSKEDVAKKIQKYRLYAWKFGLQANDTNNWIKENL